MAGLAVPPAHPLFRETWAYAFDVHEQLALSPAPVAGYMLQWALVSAAANGWTDAMKKIKERAAEIKLELYFNAPLLQAAAGGHMAAMQLAKESGALDYGWALVYAAKEGQLEAMRELKEWGVKDFDEALRCATENNRFKAMREVIEWGATANVALAWAAQKGNLAAMRVAKKLGATNFDYALRNAAEGGHLDAMRLARGWGVTRLNDALMKATQKRNIAAVNLLKAWAAEDRAIRSAGSAECS